MAKEKVILPAVTEYNVYVNEKPVGTHKDVATAHRLAQHYFSETIYAGDPPPTVRVTKRIVDDGDVSEEDV
jgi:hypothetical protein